MEEKIELKDAFAEFKSQKNIDRPTMMGVLEDVFRTQLAKVYGDADNFDVIINIDKGDCEIYWNREVVEKVEDPNKQISLEEVNANGDDYEIGETFAKKIEMKDFGRRGILNIRQNLQGRIMDLEKANLYNKYKDLVGQLFAGEVHQTWAKEVVILDEDGNELKLPKQEQIPGERFKKGDSVKAIIKSVEMRNTTPIITLSRVSDEFLAKLFEAEVPEIYDGLITIKKVVRIPGQRAKVAVESYDDRIDPIGACIGVKGSRIIGIVRELRNENIDVINYTSNPSLFIQRALSPAKISSIVLDEENKKAEVFLRSEEVSLAIGKGGLNIKLASKLTGYIIDVYRDTEETYDDDVYLDEFKNDIDGWVIDTLKDNGWVTAKSVLNAPRQEILDKTDLEEVTVDQVLEILKAEFENDAE